MPLRDYQKSLYRKTWEAFRDGKRRPLVVAPCGAGKSYIFAEMAKNCSGYVLILTHRKELKTQHESLLRLLGVKNARVEMIITEYNHMTERQIPRLLILDEAHLSQSNTWVSMVNHYDTFTVGFTATPVRLDGKPLGAIFDCLIQEVSVQWLIDHQCLAPFDYYAPLEVDISAARVQHGDFVRSDLEQIMSNKAIYGNVIKAYLEIAKGVKSIAYCVSIQHAKLVAEQFRYIGIRASVISSATPPTERKEIMDLFVQGKCQVLCNVGIISEGISINDVECCLLLRPTESHALYWQQAMRCMRYVPGKRAKILDFVGNYTRNPMPDEDVIWSLTEPPKKPKRMNSEGNLTVRVCKQCYRTFKTAPSCPYCGGEYPLQAREIQAHREIELKKIDAAEKERIQKEKKRLRQEVGQAKSYPELLRIAKERGYNPAWARMVWNGRKH